MLAEEVGSSSRKLVSVSG